MKDPWIRRIGWLVLALTLFRLWFCTTFELCGDEAYYRLWSKHLDICYFSKGPGVAWVIALGTALFGDHVFGIRFFSVLLSAGTGLLMATLAARLFSWRVAFWALVVASLMPFFLVGSVLMTIDPLSVFFWSLAALWFWDAKDSSKSGKWIRTGAAVGLGVVCKYTNLAELICFAVFCLFCAEYRRLLVRRNFWAMTATALLFFSPLVIWNYRHDWITWRHLLDRGELDQPLRFSINEFIGFAGEQAGVAFPLFFIGLIVALCMRRPATTPKPVHTYLLSLFLPLFLFYSALAFNDSGQPNWTAPSYVAGIILLTAAWLFLADRYRWAKRVAAGSLALAVVVAVALHFVVWFRLPLKRDPADRVRGSQGLAAQVKECQNRYGASFVIANKYSYTSLLSFYLPGRPQTFIPTAPGIRNQFSLWPGYESGHENESAIYVTDQPRVPEVLKREFRDVRSVAEVWSTHRGQNVRLFYFYLCAGKTPSL